MFRWNSNISRSWSGNCPLLVTYEGLKETKYDAAVNHPNKPISKRRKFFRNLVFPVTPLTVVTGLAVVITTIVLIQVSSESYSSALLAAICAAITFVLLVLYALDRLLVQHVLYRYMIWGEIILGVLFFFFVTLESRMTEVQIHTDELHVHPDQDYMLIVFDSKENTLDDFKRSGLWNQELHIEHQTIIHLDSALATNPRLRIKEPDHWMGYSEEEGRIQLDGRSVKYLFRSRARTPAEQALLPPLDSLLNELRQE